jgi:hypothetical protein
MIMLVLMILVILKLDVSTIISSVMITMLVLMILAIVILDVHTNQKQMLTAMITISVPQKHVILILDVNMYI